MTFFKYKKLISCEVGPNYEFDDVKVSLASILGFAPFLKQKLWVTDWFKKNLEIKGEIYYTDNGRTALFLLLKSLNLVKGSEILIQPLSCVVLPNSVWQAGYQPILVDVDPQTYNYDLADLERKITKETKAIIVQYTFGIQPDMQKIVDLCRKNNLILIEDCAHALGQTSKIDGKEYKLGQIGQLAIYSFGRDKVISTTRGGFGIINSDPVFSPSIWDYQATLQEFSKHYKYLPKMKFYNLLQCFWYAILMTTLIRPLYYSVGKWILFATRFVHIIGEIYTPAEKKGTEKVETASQFPNRLFPLLANQIQKIDKYTEHRKKLVRFYNQKLNQSLPILPLIRYPLDLQTIDTENYEILYKKIFKKGRSQGIMIGKWYSTPFLQDEMDVLKLFQISNDHIPNALSLCQNRVINLPTNIKTSLEDAQKIVDLILESNK